MKATLNRAWLEA